MAEVSGMQDVRDIINSEIENYKEIKPENGMTPGEARFFWDNTFGRELETLDVKEKNKERNNLQNLHIEVRNGENYFYDDHGKLYRVGKELAASSEYELNGYKYRTDEKGRVISAERIEQCGPEMVEKVTADDSSEFVEAEIEGLSEDEKATIKEESNWSDEIVEKIKNRKQYEILKNADLIEVVINGRKCLIKENIDFDYTDEDGISNRDRIARGLAPLDSKTGKPIELHHLGQKADSPLVELTEEEHRTGEYENGKKNQSLWHDNTVDSEVHGEGSNWDQERKAHWKARAENIGEK